MIELMNRMTDKKGWELKIHDEEIVGKWKSEALSNSEIAISEKMFDWVS